MLGLGFWTCTQILMTAHGGCTNILRKSVLKADSGEKALAAQGTELASAAHQIQHSTKWAKFLPIKGRRFGGITVIHVMLSIWWNSSCLDVVCWEFSISALHINIITADEERLSFTQNFSSLYTFRGTLFNAENTSSWSKGTLFKTKDMFPCKVV